MSKAKSRKKRLRVSIPAVNLGVLGDRNMEESSKLEKRRDELESLELEAEGLEAEARVIKRRREVDRLSQGGRDPAEPAQSDLGNRLVEEIVIPMVNERLQTKGRGDDALTKEALSVARVALQKGRPQESSVDQVTKIITLINEVKGLTQDNTMNERLDKMKESIEKIEKKDEKVDGLDQLERTISFLDKAKEVLGMTSGGVDHESTRMVNEQRRWEHEFNAKEKTRDRAFNLRLRQMDKKHDLELAKLGIARERNDLLDSGLKKLGTTFFEAVVEEDEGSGVSLSKQKDETVQIPCSECGVMLTIPPEAQRAGVEVGCPKCQSRFNVVEE